MSVFIDTGPWYASVVPSDPRYATIIAWLRSNTERLVTTDYVIDESLTLLRSRGEHARAVALGRQLWDLAAVPIHFLSEEDLRDAWKCFRDNPDRSWSFTDCSSKVVIQRLHLKRVLTFDHHFAEFGAIELLP